MCGGGTGRLLVVSYRSSSGKLMNHWSSRVSISENIALLEVGEICRTEYILVTIAPEMRAGFKACWLN